MNEVDKSILNIDRIICEDIENYGSSKRGRLSQHILSQLRTFVEHISIKIFSKGKDLEVNYDNIKKALNYISTTGKLKFLKDFHSLLQISTSHYTFDEENSERLMLKYYEYLLRIKIYLKEEYSLDVLENIEKFPVDIDNDFNEYYIKIAENINEISDNSEINSYSMRYYVKKIKPFFVNNKIYYEVTFTTANDSASKFDRVIAFTKYNIPTNYSVQFSLEQRYIKVLNNSIPILLIKNWKVSIRPCEINKLGNIVGKYFAIRGNNKEYLNLMDYLSVSGLNLLEIIELEDSDYNLIKTKVIKDSNVVHIFLVLDICRKIVLNNKHGCNVIRYLLYKLNNKVLKGQYYNKSCDILSGLYLQCGCKVFDQMPFCSSLMNHNPIISDLFSCIDSNDREYELLARYIKNNAENKGIIYNSINDLSKFENLQELIKKYNSKVYCKHTHRILEKYKNNVYMKQYESDTAYILKNLKKLTQYGVQNYRNSFESWLLNSSYKIDSDEKREVLKNMFENSSVSFIYGSAGTGKSTLINHISNFFAQRTKLYLTNTNPAINNLKRKVSASGCEYMTIAKFLSRKNTYSQIDLLFIDECSTVSNSDMKKILQKANFKLLILVGDIYQIESINFGNWFNMAYRIMPCHSIYELKEPHRATNDNLKKLWGKVRNIDGDILEHITRYKYSERLNESIFKNEDNQDDEIILCLNYDGLYGINNINRILQANNNNPPIQWGIETYKVGDPILFNESERYSNVIYNNMKGKIVSINKSEEKIEFDIAINEGINGLQLQEANLQLINYEGSRTVIRFSIDKYSDNYEDDDSSSNTIVPFQVAYAVSIHKAQGLEYNSVKIVITDVVDEVIDHNIFYTAITRAKERLKIYWSPESEKRVLSCLEHKINNKDMGLFCNKYALK